MMNRALMNVKVIWGSMYCAVDMDDNSSFMVVHTCGLFGSLASSISIRDLPEVSSCRIDLAIINKSRRQSCFTGHMKKPQWLDTERSVVSPDLGCVQQKE